MLVRKTLIDENAQRLVLLWKTLARCKAFNDTFQSASSIPSHRGVTKLVSYNLQLERGVICHLETELSYDTRCTAMM